MTNRTLTHVAIGFAILLGACNGSDPSGIGSSTTKVGNVYRIEPTGWWTTIPSMRRGESINAMLRPADKTLLAFGNGRVYRSTDDGGRWSHHDIQGLSTVPSGTRWVIDPVLFDDGTIVAPTTGGGLYRSTDGGITWRDLGRAGEIFLAAAGLGDGAMIAVARTYTELASFVLRSTDRGTTWDTLGRMPLGPTCGGLLVAMNNSILSHSVDRGVVRSTDGGRTWTDVPDLDGGGVVAVMRLANGTILAGTAFGRLHRSSDNGATWNASDGGLPGFSIVTSFREVGGVVYAGTAGNGIFASSDDGRLWSRMSWCDMNINCIEVLDDGSVLAGTSAVPDGVRE